MGELAIIAAGGAVASLAWLYQRAWERHERRVERYERVIDCLPAFVASRLNPESMDAMIAEHHRLWLFAPDNVIEAGERLLDAIEGLGGDPNIIVGEYVVALRNDASMWSAVVPRLGKSLIPPRRFKLRSANRTARAA